MSNKNKTTSEGFRFFENLQLIFITLKLCKVIEWSWWLVLIPTFVSLTLVLVFFIIGVILAIIDKLKGEQG